MNPNSDFSNLNPDTFRELIVEEINVLKDFLDTKNSEIAILRGKKAATTGLDNTFITTVCKIFKSFFPEYMDKRDIDFFLHIYEIIDTYKDVYQDAYLKQIMIEQAGLFKAQARTVIKQQQEIIRLQKEKLKAIQKAKRQVEKVNKEQRLFLAAFAHETMTPLTIIKNSALTLRQQAGS